MNEPAAAQVQAETRPTVSPAQGAMLQRQCACGQHTGGGECEECKQKHQGVLQRAAVQPGQGYKEPPKETQRSRPPTQLVDESLPDLRMPYPRQDFSGIPPFKSPATLRGSELPDLESAGEPTPGNVRSRFERGTGASLTSVRIHLGASSQHIADALQARAFTIGQHIHFAAGEFQPGTPQGDHLLIHELTHTVQQKAAAPTAQRQARLGEMEDEAEVEAEAVADALSENTDEVETESKDESELETGAEVLPPITARPSPIALAPKKKKAAPKKASPAKPAKPKQIPFSLFSTKFNATVDSSGQVSVKAKSKTDGWTFNPGAANTVTAERTLGNLEYAHAGGTTEPMVEKTTITVPAGGPASVQPIEAVLGNPATLTIPLSGAKRAAKRKPVVVNGATLAQLDLPATAITFTPGDGDVIHLGLNGEAWVFTTLKQDPVPPATSTTDIQGFFTVGSFTRYNDHGTQTFGVDSTAISSAARRKEIEDLADPSTPAARRISAEEADVFKTVATIEGDLAAVQTYDTGILSFGFSQWTVNSDLPRMLLKVKPAVFERYLGRYGLSVSAPVRQLDASVAKFAPTGRRRLGVRNNTEGALFLNGRELVTEALLNQAGKRTTALDTLAKQGTALKSSIAAIKPDLTSSDKAKKNAAIKAMADAKKKLKALQVSLKGLPGLKTDADPEKQADILVKVATDAHDEAKDVVDNCDSSQVMRQAEWALRFEMLGQDPDAQDAEIAQARETYKHVKGLSTHGASYETLLPNDRGRATLLSSYFNNPTGTQNGMSRSVDKFKTQKKTAAKAAAAAAAAAKKPVPSPTEADWDAFPWKTTDPRWASLWPASSDDFEKIAIVEMTTGTTDPTGRRKTIKSLFP